MRKICNQYFFSVEGETEELYLKHLQNLINSDENLEFKVKFDIKRCKWINKRAKRITAPYKVSCFHICDYESNSEEHKKNFQEILKQINDVKKINKNLNYTLGYSNYTFELWIILHKSKLFSYKGNRRQYLKEINNAYGEKFKSLDQYKEEKNFKRILNKIQLEDVIFAVKNGEEIRKRNENSNKIVKKSGKISYYEENPDLTIHECIKKILEDVGIKDFSKS